jgi:guanylate kinase
MEVLEKRLANRGTESAESLAKRTQNAREEVKYGIQPGNFDFIVVNDDLDDACRQFAAAVDDAYPNWK